jgi:hypothetical protein
MVQAAFQSGRGRTVVSHMPAVLRFGHDGASYEVQATLIGDKLVVRVFTCGDGVPGAGYSTSSRGVSQPTI